MMVSLACETNGGCLVLHVLVCVLRLNSTPPLSTHTQKRDLLNGLLTSVVNRLRCSHFSIIIINCLTTERLFGLKYYTSNELK